DITDQNELLERNIELPRSATYSLAQRAFKILALAQRAICRSATQAQNPGSGSITDEST
ncbi:hypothetical protein A2U01_0102829, partial [Trifolium medium]|nr:hypothetical protein [Trifolium medium]